MITGYNNDIKHRGTIFHVQTEDKGEASAWIESLIYTGGRILARKRATYKQLLEEGADKPAIAKLMERQHRLMIRQIREGRFDEETSDGVPQGAQPPAEDDPDIHTTRMQQQAEAMFAPSGATGTPPSDVLEREAAAARAAVDGEAEGTDERKVAAPAAASTVTESAPDAATPEAAEAPSEDAPVGATEQAEAPVEVAGAPAAGPPAPETPPPSEEPAAAAASSEAPAEAAPESGEVEVEEDDDDVELEVGPAPTLDQVIFDYLSSVAQEESLVLLMDESPALASGTTTRMDLGTHASRSGKPIAKASIAVRMISKTGGPVTLAEGVTDEEGTLQLVVDVPEVERDSAALIITAASSIGNAEIKHLL